MKKYDTIVQLAKETVKQVSKNAEEWTKYLTTASRLYRYSFHDQLLIYAQRPDATACAAIEIWNDAMHCWVNRGAKGIALIDEDNSKLKYVFDVSDVHKSRTGRDPNLWIMKDEHKDTVIKQLGKVYGEGAEFEEQLIKIAGGIAQDYYDELALDINFVSEGSFLEDLDEQNVKVRIRETLHSSIAYMLLSRCGADMAAYQDNFNFDYIHDFNTVETLSVIGSATTDFAMPVLMDIGKAVKGYERAKMQKEKNISQKSIENVPNIDYNTLKRKSAEYTHQSEVFSVENEKGEKEHGSDLRKEWGLYDTTASDGQAAGGSIDEIRIDEKELFAGAQERNLQRTSAEWKVEGTPSYDPGAGRAENGTADGTDAEEPGRERTIEIGKSDALGAEDEQYQAVSRGSRAEGTDIQLNNEEPRPDSEKELSGLSLSKIEHGILQFDQFMIHKCPDIAGYFLFEQNEEKQTEYVKNSYKHNEYTEFYVEKERAGYIAKEDGLTMWQGSYLSRIAEMTVSWNDVRDRIAFYLKQKEYLQAGQIPQWNEPKTQYEQISLFPSFEEQVGSIAAAEASVSYTRPAAFSLPQEQMEAILRSGGGRDNSRKRIYAKYQQGKTQEQMADILKNEYETTGKGFDFGEHPVSVWFDESGMRIAYGTSAKEATMQFMDWREIESNIRSMVEQGTYMSANEAFLVDPVERKRIANQVYYFFRDGMNETPETFGLKSYNYPESESRLMELLSTPEGRELITAEILKAKKQLDSGEKSLRWRYVKKPDYLLEEISGLNAKQIAYPTADQVEVLSEDFITQDEIDARLTGGSNVQHGQFRIYEHFLKEHDAKENIAFLKDEYGVGGSSHALPGSDKGHEDHDAKGIRLEKGSYGNPYTKVLLKWNVVEKRIRQLIKEDRYLSPKGKEAYVQYKQEQAKEAMRREQEKLEHGKTLDNKADNYSVQDDIVKADITDDFSDIDVEAVREGLKQSGIVDGQVVDENALEQSGFIRKVTDDVQELTGQAKKEPEIDRIAAANYRISMQELADDTAVERKGFAAKEKFRQNVTAIQTLEQIENEHRIATPQEQEILAKYVGWGGLADAFDDQKAAWENEYQELRSLLSPEEYSSARESTLNAHFTSPVVIKSIFDQWNGWDLQKVTF